MLNLSDVKALLHEGEGQDILSLYLHVDNAVPENQATNPAWRTWLKQHLRSVDNHLMEGERQNWETIRARVEEYFQDFIPSSKSVVAFFGANWEQVYTLPVPVENQGAYGKPLVTPLLWAMDEYEPYLVVKVDQEEAHFYESYLGQTDFRDSIEIDLDEYDFAQKTGKQMAAPALGGQSRAQANNRDEFEDTINEHRMRFYRDVAEHTRQLVKKEGIERIIIGGNEDSGHTVRRLLAQSVEKHVVDVVSIPRYYGAHDIFAHMQPLALEHEREKESQLVDEVINAARAGGRGALGLEAVNNALQLQQVSHLILAWPPNDSRLANDLAYRALKLNSEVITVHGAPAGRLRREGEGVAARLYYAI
jgi:hypothetical protein